MRIKTRVMGGNRNFVVSRQSRDMAERIDIFFCGEDVAEDLLLPFPLSGTARLKTQGH